MSMHIDGVYEKDDREKCMECSMMFPYGNYCQYCKLKNAPLYDLAEDETDVKMALTNNKIYPSIYNDFLDSSSVPGLNKQVTYIIRFGNDYTCILQPPLFEERIILKSDKRYDVEIEKVLCNKTTYVDKSVLVIRKGTLRIFIHFEDKIYEEGKGFHKSSHKNLSIRHVDRS